MAPPTENDGPDGSSIKPVSSLRSHFEKMNRGQDEGASAVPAAATAPTAAQPPPRPAPRAISPAPKPDKLRDAPPPPPAPASRSADRNSKLPETLNLSLRSVPAPGQRQGQGQAQNNFPDANGPRSPTTRHIIPPPPLSPKPIRPPPMLLVQPPQSPPKGRVLNLALAADHSAFLNPDSVVASSNPTATTPTSNGGGNTAPSTPATANAPPRPFKMPSRPHTPSSLEPRRSPRLAALQGPPSPPPPRRSAELRRERDRDPILPTNTGPTKLSPMTLNPPGFAPTSAPAPPPINRADKPTVPTRKKPFLAAAAVAAMVTGGGRGANTRGGPAASIATENSPFSSPPSSPDEERHPYLPPEVPVATRPAPLPFEEADEPPPPTLPTRPRPQPSTTVSRSNTLQGDFEPPPVHHSVARRRGGHDTGPSVNGVAKGHVTPQLTGEARPALPARPQTVVGGGGTELVVHGGVSRPPPRSGLNAAVNTSTALSSTAKRVVSTPTTQHHHPPPPTRQNTRAMTVDRAGADKVPPEFRQPPPPSSSSVVVSSAPDPRGSDTALIPASKTEPAGANQAAPSLFPDATRTNRRPPYAKLGAHEIYAKQDSRVSDVCAAYVATAGHVTRVWSLLDGELLTSLAHAENVKATAVLFKPAADVKDEGSRLWIGTSDGELMEADVMTGTVMATKPNAHARHEVIRLYRRGLDVWSLDEYGTLNVWGPDADEGVPSLNNSPDQAYRLPRGHTFSLVVGDELWHATGKEIRVFLPTAAASANAAAQFQVLVRPLGQDGAGDVTSGCLLRSRPDSVFFGHTDGKVTVYSRRDYACVAVHTVTSYKINTLCGGTGADLWAGFNTGRICVYDMDAWSVKKDWQAHGEPVLRIVSDAGAAAFALDRPGRLVSLGADGAVRAWDGLLQDDWLDRAMEARERNYCATAQLRAMVLTWNAGAATPNSLRYSDGDATFVRDLLQNSGSPDILVFGFQELVDLEDKAATAKRFLKGSKKKEGSDQERMSHQYRDWRDFLVRSLDDYMPRNDLYHLLQTATLVGLFTCIFVKASIRDRITNLSVGEVKRGMGGLHGNKGAIVVRFVVDDTSLCFVNCHLAAGQTQATHRHNDVAAILEAAVFPAERDPTLRADRYAGGGDGSMITDHELCVLNGDLNYRIDTMSRDTVVAAVKSRNLAKLLDRDQLLVARRRNPAFKLRAFDELPIGFAPTYKYDVGTDNYDTSEKRRSPAWCDRLLFRAAGGEATDITQLDYTRHEVRVSDHRPVTGRFLLTVKRVAPKERAAAWMDCQHLFEDLKAKEGNEEKLYYLTTICGYDQASARRLIKEKSARNDRSPSRHRELSRGGG